ncbi:MAG TPA: TetR/AcrR family transcriptional regulator [Rhizomicrobium sp.]|nr:TetR/AcrR family transcriptional regulator [Rhizomicrobium sp.]
MKPRPSAPAPYHHGDLRRALIAAALALVTEEQDWTFSLREVARRAGVSQSAPYNHFADKRDLLAAVAVAGFHQLRDGLVAAVTGLDDAPDAFAACLRTYVRLGMRNPALYRLMFGPELTESKGAKRPREVAEAGGEAKSILERIIRDGATSGVFAVPTGPNGQPLALATFIAWSAVHGLTMLVIDKLTGELVPVQRAIEAAIAVQLDGVRGGARAASTRQRGAAASAVERDG